MAARRRPGVRAQVLLLLLVAVLIPLAAEAVAFVRLDAALEEATQAEAQARVEDTQDIVDARLQSALRNATRAAADPPPAAFERVRGPAWFVRGSDVESTDDAPPDLAEDAVVAARGGQGVVLAPLDGNARGFFVLAGRADGVLVVFHSSGELLAGTPGGRLARTADAGDVAAPLFSAGAFIVMDPPEPLAGWRIAATALLAFTAGGVGLVALLLTRRVVRPLRDLQAASAAFAAGRLDARAADSGTAETAAVAAQFNAMADALARHERDLRARAQSLEADVKDLEFAAAHDFRETLRSIGILAGHVLEDAGDRLDEDARRALASCTTAAKHLEAVSADVARILEAGRRPLASEAVAVREAARDAVAMAAAPPGAVLVEGDAAARADPQALREVLAELVRNGLRYNDNPEPRVIVRALEVDGHVRVVVEDNGIGIPAAMRREVLRPFRRLHPRGTYPGTGAGLAVVERLVERHGGAIEIDAAPDGGTRVTFALPAASAGEPAANGREA